MTTSKARTTVLIGAAGTGALVTVASIVGGDGPRFTILIGVGVVGTALLAVAEYAPELAAAFAGLVLATALFTSGGLAVRALSNYLGR